MTHNKQLNICLFAFGTDGDIQPLIKLALGLHQHGHNIELAIVCLRNRDYSYLSQDETFKVHMIPYPSSSAMNEFTDKEFWNFSESEFSSYFDAQFKAVRNTIRRWANALAKKVDLMISIRLMYPVRFSAEQQGIPYVCLHFAHSFIKSKYYPPFGVSDQGEQKNLLAWQDTAIFTTTHLLPAINKFKELYALPSCADFYSQAHHSATLNLVAFSRHLLPYDIDWDDTFHLCGYFKSKTVTSISHVDTEIEQFILQGKDVISVTFGSLLEYENNPAEFLTAVSDTIRALGIRAIILTNCNYGLKSDENIFFAEGYINHEKLFSKSRLVVHHGGAGTAHVVAACGVPSVLVAYGFDQFSIGDLLVKAGVCKCVLARKDFDKEKFGWLLTSALSDPQLSASAIKLGKLIATDNGIENAIELIEKTYA